VIVGLYLTIWVSLVLFAVGESGRRRPDAVAGWAWPAFAAGLLLCLIHIVIAIGSVHGWNHAAVVASTRAQTESVYGIDWGGGVFVNYLFVAAWAIDAWSWRAAALRGRPLPARWRWPLRLFYAIVVLNAAVIFAAGTRRLLGLAIVGWLLWLWTKSGPYVAPSFSSASSRTSSPRSIRSPPV
jgi:hypothetical protein